MDDVRRTSGGIGSLLLAGVASLALCAPARALTINATFDPSVSSSARTAFNFAAGEYQALFNDPITINIRVTTGTTGIGESSTALTGLLNYSQIRTDLITDYVANPSAARTIATGPGGSISMTTDPTSGGTFFLSTAEGKALGLIPGNATALDGTFTYNQSLSYTFDPNNRAVAGAFDFIAVAEEEISDIMGRLPGLGTNIAGNPSSFLPYDLFRYMGNNIRGITNNGAGNYFSIDNGLTNLHGFNNAFLNDGDPQNWDASVPSDPFNAFILPDQAHMISPEDITALNVLGYDTAVVTVATPEPGSLALLAAGLASLGLLRRPRRG